MAYTRSWLGFGYISIMWYTLVLPIWCHTALLCLNPITGNHIQSMVMPKTMARLPGPCDYLVHHWQSNHVACVWLNLWWIVHDIVHNAQENSRTLWMSLIAYCYSVPYLLTYLLTIILAYFISLLLCPLLAYNNPCLLHFSLAMSITCLQ